VQVGWIATQVGIIGFRSFLQPLMAGVGLVNLGLGWRRRLARCRLADSAMRDDRNVGAPPYGRSRSDGADLLHETQCVVGGPRLGDAAALDSCDADARGHDLPARRRDALELALVRTSPGHPDHDLVVLGDDVFDRLDPVRERARNIITMPLCAFASSGSAIPGKCRR
jgi:hypothetical protein